MTVKRELIGCNAKPAVPYHEVRDCVHEEGKLRRSDFMTIRARQIAIVILTAAFIASVGPAFAQGFDLGQLFGGGGTGGGGSRHQRTNSGQGDGSAISVERSAPPFTGKFSGKQDDQGAETTLTAQFACYPASDSDIPQAKAFVCYTAPAKANNQSGAAAAYGPPPDAGTPSGAPPDIE